MTEDWCIITNYLKNKCWIFSLLIHTCKEKNQNSCPTHFWVGTHQLRNADWVSSLPHLNGRLKTCVIPHYQPEPQLPPDTWVQVTWPTRHLKPDWPARIRGGGASVNLPDVIVRSSSACHPPHALNQARASYGPRTWCGPLKVLIWADELEEIILPSMIIELVIEKNMDLITSPQLQQPAVVFQPRLFPSVGRSNESKLITGSDR